MINEFLTCPADCDTALVLGALPTKQDCTSWKQRYAQVRGLLIIPTGAAPPLDFTTPKDPTVNPGEIDNTDVTGLKSKLLFGEGEIPEPEATTDDYPNRKQRDAFKTYTLTHTIKSLDDETYEFLRLLQCGRTDFTFMYDTVGNWLFSDAAVGISPDSVRVAFPRGGGRDDKELATITLVWEADGDPDRANSPFPAFLDSL
jgi:hypothetical protein